MFVINQTDTQVIEEPDASDHVDRKIFRFGEVDGRLPFQITDRQRDFVAVGGERASGGTNALGAAAPQQRFWRARPPSSPRSNRLLSGPGKAGFMAQLSGDFCRRPTVCDLEFNLAVSKRSRTYFDVMPPEFEDLLAANFYQKAEVWAILGYDVSQPWACRSSLAHE